MSHQEARSESQHQGQPPTDPVSGEVDELQEANGRLLIASLQAEEQVETHVALNTALRQLMETRQQAADEREHLLARERDARTQLEAFAAEHARQRRTFEALLDASADHIFMLDPAGRFAYVNRAAALVVGAASLATEGDSERILGRTARELGFTEGFLQQFEGNHARAMCGETSVAEISFSSPSGVRMFEYVLSPVRGDDGGTEFVVGVTRDIDDRKRAEAEHESLLVVAQAAREQAEAALKVRDEFLAIASHELLNPVTHLKGRAQLVLRWLQRESLDKIQASAQVHAIIESADRLAALVADLMDVSRMRSGGPLIQPGRLDVATLICTISRRHAESVGDRHHILIEVPDDSAMLNGDAGRLEQVLDNLLGNAVKYSPRGVFNHVCRLTRGVSVQPETLIELQ